MGSSSDSESLSPTPPSSPVLGYSGIRIIGRNIINGDGTTITASADSRSQLIFAFNCKGCPRVGSNDCNFHPNSLILRRQLISTLEVLATPADHTPSSSVRDCLMEEDNNGSGSLGPAVQLYPSFFGQRNLNPMDHEELKILLKLGMRNIHMLQVKGTGMMRESNSTGLVDPWEMRSQVIHFFTFLGQRRTGLWQNHGEMDTFFSSFKTIFGNVRDNDKCWTEEVKSYTGSKNGNECSSPLYHFFHVLLDVRWAFVRCYGTNQENLKWTMSDLIQLAWTMFNVNKEACVGDKQPFNCWCVKELWTMIRLFCDEFDNVKFWTILEESLKAFLDSETLDIKRQAFFPIWLISHLCTLSDYQLNGVYSPEREKSDRHEGRQHNGYSLVVKFVNAWIKVGGKDKPCEMMRMLQEFPKYWGVNLELVLGLWRHWLPKMDKMPDDGPDGYGLEHYSSVGKWLKLINSFKTSESNVQQQGRRREERASSSSELEKLINNDQFLSYLRLVVFHASIASTTGNGKEWRKMKSNIGMSLTKQSVGQFGEVGLLRLSTMYLTLAVWTMDTKALSDRLREVLQYAKGSPSRTKAVFRATAVALNILLQKNHDIRQEEIASSFMSTVTTLLAESPLDSSKKDRVMIYIELLDTLPSTPSFCSTSLGRESLISPNLTMWLTSCGPNYVVRSIRTLQKLTEWIITSKLEKTPPSPSQERDELASKIGERTTNFLTSSAIQSINRIPSTDVEPMAKLGADLTLIAKWNEGASSVTRLFDHFALNERTCPLITQYYISRLMKYQEVLKIQDLKWYQSWIRLIALDLFVPEDLNEKVFGNGTYMTTDNEQLLHRFCSRGDEWSRGELQGILQPLVILCKVGMTLSIFKDDKILGSIIKSCGKIIGFMDFDKIYVKGDSMSIAVQILSWMIPPVAGDGVPPWEKYPREFLNGLRAYLFDMFKAIIHAQGFAYDVFLQRKIVEIVTLGVLVFLDSNQEGDDEGEDNEGPGVGILVHFEDVDMPQVFQKCINHIIKLATSGDLKLTSRFVRAITYLKDKGLTTSVIRFLPGILETYVNVDISLLGLSNYCIGIISYACTFGGSPAFQDSVLKTFETKLESSFSFKSKRFFDLANVLAKGRMQVKTFLKDKLLPLYKKYVIITEERRGTGLDKSLRDPLDKLETAVTL